MLQTLAIKLLGQLCSSSCVERNWKTYGFVHSLKKNKITPKHVEDLIFIHSNFRLLSRRSDKYIKEKLRSGTLIVILWMSHLEEEDLEIANPSLDEPEMEIRLVEIDGEDNGEEDDVM